METRSWPNFLTITNVSGKVPLFKGIVTHCWEFCGSLGSLYFYSHNQWADQQHFNQRGSSVKWPAVVFEWDSILKLPFWVKNQVLENSKHFENMFLRQETHQETTRGSVTKSDNTAESRNVCSKTNYFCIESLTHQSNSYQILVRIRICARCTFETKGNLLSAWSGLD